MLDKDVPLKIRTNPLRNDIDLLLMDGKSYSFIAKWCKEQGHPVSRQTISKYHNECLNVNMEAAYQYQEVQSQEILAEGVKSKMSELDLLDEVIQSMADINYNLLQDKDKIDYGIKAIKLKNDILDAGDSNDSIAESLNLIAAAIIGGADTRALVGRGARRSFNDTSKDKSS